MRTPDPWPAVFMNVARAVARRSKDPSTQCGAALVAPDHRILATGFNGPPPQIDDAKIPWHTRPDKYRWLRHSEFNAIRYGIAAYGLHGLRGATIYVNTKPCHACVLHAIENGVVQIVYDDLAVRPVMVDADDDRYTAEILATLKPDIRFAVTPLSALG